MSPTPDALAAAIQEQRIRRAVERRILPYGGDKAVARSIAEVHRPTRWPFMDRCTGCGGKWPCRDRCDAQVVLDA